MGYTIVEFTLMIIFSYKICKIDWELEIGKIIARSKDE
jgi:hypothetical protein